MFRVKVFRLNLGALGTGVKVGTWPLCSTNLVKRIIWGIFSVVLFNFFFYIRLQNESCFFCWIHVFRENFWISLTSGLTTIMQIKICQSINWAINQLKNQTNREIGACICLSFLFKHGWDVLLSCKSLPVILIRSFGTLYHKHVLIQGFYTF